MQTTFTKLSHHLCRVLDEAWNLAREQRRKTVEPLHLLAALLAEPGSLAYLILHQREIHKAVRRNRHTPKETTFTIRPDAAPSQDYLPPPLNPAAERLLVKSFHAASKFHHPYVGTEHLLLSLTQEEFLPAAMRKRFRLDDPGLAEQLVNLLKSTSKLSELIVPLLYTPAKASERKTPVLEFFARELTSPAIAATLDPLVGRQEECERLIHVLCRRAKNNPLLIGEAGVGKTALVEGLAKKIASHETLGPLLGRRIFALDLGSMVAGTQYRGEFESRLKQIVQELKEHPEIIIFIDELHTVVGAGSASGTLDAANILKPALARGEIRCIGATTPKEYRASIAEDRALARRFQTVFLEEPTVSETASILKGLKETYEQHHHVKIPEALLETAVNLAHQYLPNLTFPDKAIDLLDEAMAQVKIQYSSSHLKLQLATLRRKMNDLTVLKERAVKLEAFGEALQTQDIIEQLTETLEEGEDLVKTEEATWPELTLEAIQTVLVRRTNLPAAETSKTMPKTLTEISLRLRQELVGQDSAIQKLSARLQEIQLGLVPRTNHRGAFLIVGPSGVGKTTLARRLAHHLFGNERALIRLDMSEFKEAHSASRLIGAPAGYVGFKEPSPFERLKHSSGAVILFDDLDQAHPHIQATLLSLIEDGRLEEASGETIYFRNAVLLATANLGLSDWTASGNFGFASAGDKTFELPPAVDRALKEHFREEFLGRFNQLLVLNVLNPEHIKTIIQREITQLKITLEAQSVALDLVPEALDWLSEKSYSKTQGARHVRAVFDEHLTAPLAELLVQEPKRPITVKIKLVDQRLIQTIIPV